MQYTLWSYLWIYISQNIALCKGNFEGQFQKSLQVRLMIFYLKIHTYFTHFLSTFCRSFQIHCFLHNCYCCSNELTCLSCNLMEKCDSHWSYLEIITVCNYYPVKNKCILHYSKYIYIYFTFCSIVCNCFYS